MTLVEKKNNLIYDIVVPLLNLTRTQWFDIQPTFGILWGHGLKCTDEDGHRYFIDNLMDGMISLEIMIETESGDEHDLRPPVYDLLFRKQFNSLSEFQSWISIDNMNGLVDLIRLMDRFYWTDPSDERYYELRSLTETEETLLFT